MNQDISVVIPAYFNSDEFKLTFASVLSQSKCSKEIIISMFNHGGMYEYIRSC
jgi:glycosyltransferase involved in cell wall biosynthesis